MEPVAVPRFALPRDGAIERLTMRLPTHLPWRAPVAAITSAVFALAASSPAWAEDKSADGAAAGLGWEGVWQGTVGQAEVRLCVQRGDSELHGVYYYKRYLSPISLNAPRAPQASSQALVLEEQMAVRQPVAKGRASTPASLQAATQTNGLPRIETVTWRLEPPEPGAAGQAPTLTGSWRSSSKALPVRLTRVPEAARTDPNAANDYEGPCEGDAFNAPRELPPRLLVSEARLAVLGQATSTASGTAYRLLTLDFAQRFSAEIRSFELLRDDAGARRFNQAQRKQLDADQHEVFGCTRAVIGHYFQQGDYNTAAEPVSIGQRWLVLRRNASNYCGGAHPNAYSSYETWRLDDGREVNPWTWFGPKGAVVRTEGEGESRYTTTEIKPAMLAMLAKAWPRDDEGCNDVVTGAFSSSWSIYPSQQGMVFMPQLPHVIYACTEEITLPWAKVLPLLSAAGRKAAEAARADLAHPPAR
jgi:hypothetical protein